jgi:rubrerythrin
MKIKDGEQENLRLYIKRAMEHENAMIVRTKTFKKYIKDKKLVGLLNQCQKVAENHLVILKKYWDELKIEVVTKANMSVDTLDQLEETQKQLRKNEAFYNEAILDVLNPLIRDMLTDFIEDDLKLYFSIREEVIKIKNKPQAPTLGIK